MSATRIIPIVTKKFGSLEAMVDADKYELAMSVDTAWGVCWNTRTFYVRRNIIGPERRYKGEKQLLHHLLLGSPPPGMVIDFINHHGLDCRIQNLRFASPKDDQGNRCKVYSSTAPYKGVTSRGSHIWEARLLIHGVRTSLGCFHTAAEAAHAYNRAASAYFGEFALLNIIEETSGREDLQCMKDERDQD
jgi:hypothetical protein